MHCFKRYPWCVVVVTRESRLETKELYKAYKHAYLLAARFVANGDMPTVHSKS
jgi:hypothetical protein